MRSKADNLLAVAPRQPFPYLKMLVLGVGVLLSVGFLLMGPIL